MFCRLKRVTGAKKSPSQTMTFSPRQLDITLLFQDATDTACNMSDDVGLGSGPHAHALPINQISTKVHNKHHGSTACCSKQANQLYIKRIIGKEDMRGFALSTEDGLR